MSKIGKHRKNLVENLKDLNPDFNNYVKDYGFKRNQQ